MRKSILWLIVARSGSKSIPDKNIKLLGGIPLLAYRILTASRSTKSNDIWISTDSKYYADIANKYGAQIPFIRPSNLSGDSSSSIDVVIHAMNHATELGLEYDFIGLLEPTSPFISSIDLDKAIGILYTESDVSSVIAVRESRPHVKFIQEQSKYLSQIAENLNLSLNLGRQNFSKQITPSGGFYISKWNNLLETKSFYTQSSVGYLVDDISGLEIDEPIDFEFAQFVVEKNLFRIN